MDKRPGIIVIALFSIAVAACSVEAAPRAPEAAHAAAPTAAPADPYFYGWPGGVQATPPPADPYFYGRPGGVQETPSTTAPNEDYQSLLTSRKDGRAPSFANASKAPAEDFQSLHATYQHLKR